MNLIAFQKSHFISESEKKIKELLADFDFDDRDERSIKFAINMATDELKQLREYVIKYLDS
jgi:hypothetical protein